LGALLCFLGANFFGPLFQAGFVLLKRDPDNQIATDNLTAESGLARARLSILSQRRSCGRKDPGAPRPCPRLRAWASLAGAILFSVTECAWHFAERSEGYRLGNGVRDGKDSRCVGVRLSASILASTSASTSLSRSSSSCSASGISNDGDGGVCSETHWATTDDMIADLIAGLLMLAFGVTVLLMWSFQR
jgi:hypothetical protein